MIRQARTGGQQGLGAPAASAAAGRPARWVARLVGLFLAVLLVVGIGVGMAPAEPQAPVYSASEQVQLDAEGRYRALAADARAAAAADPALAGTLQAVADDLAAQADAVALPRSPAPSGSPAGPTPAASPTPASATPQAVDPSAASAPVGAAEVLHLLHDSALRSLRDAVGAAPGPARVLASAGAGQWRHAALLGAALDVDAALPSADALPAADLAAGTGLFAGADRDPAVPSAHASPGSEPGPGAPPGGVPADCDGTPQGPEADRQALLSAKTAEDRARFGYEVAAALLPDTPALLARSSVHGTAADAAADRLADLCVPPAPAPAGFVIGGDFRADPAAALRDLEQEHAGLYAGLIPAVGPDTRAWAVAAFNAAAQRSLDAGTPLGPFPGLQDAPEPSAPEDPADGE